MLTEIDVAGTLKKKLNVDFRRYRILGACNPRFAYEALQAEDEIGTGAGQCQPTGAPLAMYCAVR